MMCKRVVEWWTRMRSSLVLRPDQVLQNSHPAGLLDPTHSPPNPRIERSKSLGLKLDKNFVIFQNLDSKKLPRFFLGLQMM